MRKSIQELASKLAEVIKISDYNLKTFIEQLELLLGELEQSLKRQLTIENDIAFEDAEKKLRTAQIAFDKLSNQQRDMIHLAIQETQTAVVTIQFLPDDSTQEIADYAPWPRPEDLISGIVGAFAILTGKNPRPKHIASHYLLRKFILNLRKLVESCGGDLPYPDRKARGRGERGGGHKFDAVMDILKANYPLVPRTLPLSSIEKDWSAQEKS